MFKTSLTFGEIIQKLGEIKDDSQFFYFRPLNIYQCLKEMKLPYFALGYLHCQKEVFKDPDVTAIFSSRKSVSQQNLTRMENNKQQWRLICRMLAYQCVVHSYSFVSTGGMIFARVDGLNYYPVQIAHIGDIASQAKMEIAEIVSDSIVHEWIHDVPAQHRTRILNLAYSIIDKGVSEARKLAQRQANQGLLTLCRSSMSLAPSELPPALSPPLFAPAPPPQPAPRPAPRPTARTASAADAGADAIASRKRARLSPPAPAPAPGPPPQLSAAWLQARAEVERMREAIDITRAEHLSVKAEPGTAPIAAEAASDASEALAPVLTQASGAAGGGPTLRLMTFNILNMCMEPVLPRGALAKLADPSFLRNRGGVPSEWFTRKRLKGRKNKCLAAALIHDASPDVLCLTEVASLAVLDYFNRDCLPALGYRYAVLVEGHEDAGMNVGLLSRFPIASYVLHRDDVNRAVFPRGVLEADLDVEGHMLTVYACHFKAQTDRANANEAAGAKRRLQAVHLSNLIDRRWAAVGFVGNFVVMGDLNDTPTSDALSPLLARREWVDVMSRLPQHHRWTHCYLRGPQPAYSQLDYIVASLALASSQSNCMRKPVVLRHGMRTAVSAYRGSRYEAVSDAVFASDHAPVYVDLTLLKVTQWPYLASVPMVAAPPAPKGPYMPREEFWEPQAIYRPSMVPRLTSLALSSNAEDIDSDLEICSVVPHFIDLSDEDDDVIIVEDPDDVIIDQHVPVAVLQQSEPIELD